MTKPTWYFKEFKRSDVASELDFARALFTRDESVAARSLVREAVQNSLDARQRSAKVEVRFALRTGSRAVQSDDADKFFGGLRPHVTSRDSGVEDPPKPDEPIPYLVVEDFGTRGLTGDPSTWNPPEAKYNSFFLFFRALGKSGKEGKDRGRWGVGKFVFPMTSRAHTLLALTVPENGSGPLVMGRAVLKGHVVNGITYHPNGHWGLDEDEFVLPVDGQLVADELKRLFDLRRTNETGLSVIVPWVAEVAADDLITAAAAEYFLPILRDELQVEVDDNGRVVLIDVVQLSAMADSIEPRDLRARLSLGLEAATWPSSQLIVLGHSDQATEYDWNGTRLTREQREHAEVKLEGGAVVGLRVPVTIRRKETDPVDSYFDVFIQQVSDLGRVRPLIVREGIAVSEDKTSYLQDYVALIVIDDEPLATFVGDAETPAHNELQLDLVKSKYIRANKLLSFLRSSAAAIVREIEGADRSSDQTLLAEYFPRLESAPIPRKPKPKGPADGDSTPEVPTIPNRPPRFRIGRVPSGFRVSGTGAMEAGGRLMIECAYDIRRGNALRRYRELDFIIGHDVTFQPRGITVESADANRIIASIEDPEFEVVLVGFDPNRNVFVRVVADEGGIAS